MGKKVSGGKMPWGQFKNGYIRFIEDSYLEWVRDNCDWDDDTRENCENELTRREGERYGD